MSRLLQQRLSTVVASWLERRQMVLLLERDTQFVIRVCTECTENTETGIRRIYAAAELLGSLVRILPRAWMFVSCVCCVGSDLCDGLITRPETSYRVCVYMCDLETSETRRPRSELGCCAPVNSPILYIQNTVSSC
jgi:hypothetical protein